MSRHRDLLDAQAMLATAVERVLREAVPMLFWPVEHRVAHQELDRAFHHLRVVQDSQRSEHAAVARDTSIRAAKTIRTGSQRHRVLELIVQGDGLTADQVQNCIFNGKHQSISARVSELERDGFIVDSKRRRKTSSGHQAIVWVATDRGRARIAQP